MDDIVLTCASFALGLIVVDRVGYFTLPIILAYTFAFALCVVFIYGSTPTITRTRRGKSDV